MARSGNGRVKNCRHREIYEQVSWQLRRREATTVYQQQPVAIGTM